MSDLTRLFAFNLLLQTISSLYLFVIAQGPHSHILKTGGGPSDFLGSDILAKSDFLGSVKDAGIFLGREKKTEGFFWLQKKRIKGFFWVC